MKTDRELLELAAKAAGHKVWVRDRDCVIWHPNTEWTHWNPIKNDGDTFRLEADMSFSVVVWADGVEVGEFVFKAGRFCSDPKRSSYVTFDECGGDRRAARRLAGVRAAAAIGESMP